MTRESSTNATHFTPRFASAWAALAYALCALSLAWPALTGQFLVNANSDQFRAGYSFREFAATYFREHGSIPLWNPYLQGGLPYVAAMHGDMFYPTFLLRLILPVDVAMSWGMIGHFFLCGLATYAFLRIGARLSFFGALVGGVAYMMTGFVSSLLSAGHDGKLFVNALFPVALIVLTWGIRDGKRWAWGAFALLTGLAALTPHPQLFQYMLLGSAAWGLFLAFGGTGDDRLPRNAAISRLGLAFGAVVVGMAISAIQYVPVMEYTPWSPRAGGKDYAFATSFSFPIEELFNLYLPQFSGILDQYWGRNLIHFHSEYVGVAVLMLAGAAFGSATTDARRRLIRFWLAVTIGSLLWAFGGSTPLYQLIYAIVPGAKFFRAPSTIFFMTAFAIAVLAAIGTERALEKLISRRYVTGWLIAAGVITVLAFAGAFSTIAHSLLQDVRLVDRIDAGAGALQLGAVRSLLFVAAAAGVLMAIAHGKLKGWQAGAALALLCAADLWTIERRYWGSVPPAAKLFATDPAIEYLKKQKGPFRVIAEADGSRPSSPQDPMLHWDGLMAHGIRVTYGYHGNEIGRYQVFQADEMMFNPTTWALTNTKYLLVNNDSLPIPGAKKVVGPVANAAGTLVTLYELPGDNRFAWVAPAIAKYADQSIAEAVRAPNFPARSFALVDPSSKLTGVTLTTIPTPLNLSVETTKYEPGRISLTLSEPAPAGSALVVSENYYPGWSATVDGKPVEIERTDLVLIGVPLPAGAKSIELSFTSPMYERGRLITIIAVLIALVATAAGLIPFDSPPGGKRNAAEDALALGRAA